MEDAKSVLVVLRKKNTHSESWNADSFGAMRTFLSKPPLWGTDLWTSRFIKSAQVHPVVCTSWEWLGIGAGVHATLPRLHRNKYCMEQLTSPRRKLSDITPQYHGNMDADDSWIQIEARPDIQKLPLQFSGRESGWITHTHTDSNRQLNWHTYLSQQFLGSFPVCYILSRKTTKLFMKASIYDSVVCTVQ